MEKKKDKDNNNNNNSRFLGLWPKSPAPSGNQTRDLSICSPSCYHLSYHLPDYPNTKLTSLPDNLMVTLLGRISIVPW